MKIITNTTITQIGAHGSIKPKSPLWSIYNDGDSVMVINNIFKRKPGEQFGIDVTSIVPADAAFENETVFDIRFITEWEGVHPNFAEKLKSAQLIETTFTIK